MVYKDVDILLLIFIFLGHVCSLTTLRNVLFRVLIIYFIPLSINSLHQALKLSETVLLSQKDICFTSQAITLLYFSKI